MVYSSVTMHVTPETHTFLITLYENDSIITSDFCLILLIGLMNSNENEFSPFVQNRLQQ